MSLRQIDSVLGAYLCVVLLLGASSCRHHVVQRHSRIVVCDVNIWSRQRCVVGRGQVDAEFEHTNLTAGCSNIVVTFEDGVTIEIVDHVIRVGGRVVPLTKGNYILQGTNLCRGFIRTFD